jgi:hypothetical protein
MKWPFKVLVLLLLAMLCHFRAADSIGLDGYGSIPGRTKRYFLFSPMSRLAPKTSKPPIQWEPRYLALGVKKPSNEVDHSPPSSDNVEEWWTVLCKFS